MRPSQERALTEIVEQLARNINRQALAVLEEDQVIKDRIILLFRPKPNWAVLSFDDFLLGFSTVVADQYVYYFKTWPRPATEPLATLPRFQVTPWLHHNPQVDPVSKDGVISKLQRFIKEKQITVDENRIRERVYGVIRSATPPRQRSPPVEQAPRRVEQLPSVPKNRVRSKRPRYKKQQQQGNRYQPYHGAYQGQQRNYPARGPNSDRRYAANPQTDARQVEQAPRRVEQLPKAPSKVEPSPVTSYSAPTARTSAQGTNPFSTRLKLTIKPTPKSSDSSVSYKCYDHGPPPTKKSRPSKARPTYTDSTAFKERCEIGVSIVDNPLLTP